MKHLMFQFKAKDGSVTTIHGISATRRELKKCHRFRNPYWNYQVDDTPDGRVIAIEAPELAAPPAPPPPRPKASRVKTIHRGRRGQEWAVTTEIIPFEDWESRCEEFKGWGWSTDSSGRFIVATQLTALERTRSRSRFDSAIPEALLRRFRGLAESTGCEDN